MITLSRASLDDCLDFAGGRVQARRLMVRMHQAGETMLIAEDGAAIAIAFLVPDGRGGREFCLGLSSRAGARMRELCRAAQLILGRMAQDGPIIAYVVPENRAGVRMARIVGFRPDPEHRYRWIMVRAEEERHELTVVNFRQQRRPEAGRPGGAAAGSQQ